MKNIYVTSSHERVGKSTFCLALALRLKKEGINVGYFKPISDQDEDSDSLHAKNLLKMEDDLTVINPVTISQWEYDIESKEIKSHLKKIKKSYNLLDKKYDLLIIEDCRSMGYLSSISLSSRELIKELDCEVIMLVSGLDETHLDQFVLGESFFNDVGISVYGGILTLVPLEIIERIKELAEKRLSEHGIKLMGVIPEKGDLTAPNVEELCSSIGGRVLSGSSFMDNIVEDYLVAAMEMDNALKFFRRSINKAVIVGGDRPALAIAAMETNTSAIILTGGILPPTTVLATSEDRGIPVLLVSEDTYSVVQKLTQAPVQGVLTVTQTDRIEEWDKIFNSIDYKGLIEKLS